MFYSIYKHVYKRFHNALSENGTVGVVVPVDDSVNQLVAGVGKDLVRVTWDGESDESEVPVEVLCSLDSPQAQTRINDGKVDSSGRFWLGKLKTLRINEMKRCSSCD